MRRPFQSIITIFLVCVRILGWAQSSQTVNNGQQTQAAAFPPGCVFNWTNDKPGIGLPASGTGDIASFTAINNGTTPVVATIKATPVPLGYAYISNQSSNDISVISVVTHMVVKTIPLTGQLTPFGVAATPDGSKVYVTNVSSGTVSVISTASNTVIKTITVGAGPFGIAASPNGTTVYAINSNSGTISVINTATDAVDATINGLITPQGACISPDGKWLYVTNASGNASLYIVNTATNAVDFTIPLNGTCNGGIAISPDGNSLYIANNAPGTVTVFNTITKTETKLIIGVSGPYGVAVSPDGKRVYVANNFTKKASVINAATNIIIKTINTSGIPFGVSVSTDGKELYVANHVSNKVDIISTATNNVITSVDVGSDPLALGIFTTSTGCNGPPITFSITVKPSLPTIIAGPVTGAISACVGTASASPDIQQFTVSGTDLTAGIKATAPADFQVSLSANTGYGSSVLLNQSGGKVTNVVVYVRSAATATTSVTDNVVLTSAGAASQNVAVSRVINELLTVDPVTDKTYNNGDVTIPVAFSGTANTFTWTNDKPGIGLAASGTGDITSFTAVNTGSTPVIATIKITPLPTDYAYVANQGSNMIAVINCTTHKVIKTINGGSIPVGIVTSADGKRVYIANNDASTVSVINTADNTLLTSIPVGNSPYGIAISPDGTRVYTANSNAASISVIETQSNSVLTTIPNLPSVISIAVSPDGKWMYAATEGSPNVVYIINASTNVLDSTIPLGSSYNYSMIITPDGKSLYFTNNQNSSVTRVNLATKAVSSIPVGGGPYGIAINATGTRVYVACSQASEVDIINTATNAVIKTLPATGAPFTVSVSSDDKELYVTNRSANAVDVFNTTNYSKITTVTSPAFNNPMSLGSFISKGPGCPGQPITFKITVNSKTAQITATAATGTISACAGSPSASPNIQQFTVSGTDLTAGITATAPVGFEVSLLAGGGYGNSVIINQAGGQVNNAVVYVRSAASATGNIADNVVLTSTGAADQSIAVAGIINALPTVNKPGDAIYTNGEVTTAVNFTGTGTSFTWTNDKPGIGLPANGFGDIPSFTAVNTGTTAITATIKVTPANATGCPGISQTFTIKVNASPAITTTLVSGSISACVGSASASPNIQQFTVSGTDLTADIAATAPTGFEVSLSANSGFANTVTLNQSAGKVTNVLVYVRSAASAVVGPIAGKITLATAGATNLTVGVSGAVSALPVVDAIGDKTYVNGDITTAINFTGTGNIFHWVNDTPAIGLPASGTGDLPSFTAVNVSGTQLKATITVTPEIKKYGYVTNANDNAVSVIDISTNKAVATIPVGSNPVRVTISPDGSRVYITNESSDNVSVINTSKNSVINTIPVGGVPSATVISPDGSQLYVANIYDNNISVISTGSSSVVKTIPAGLTPMGVVLSNDGKLLYVSNNGENDLWVINTANDALIANIPVGKQPEGIAMSRDGNWVYVTNFQDATISVINTVTNKVTATLPISSNPSAITVTPDGKLLYSTSDLDDKILVIDIASKQIVKTITVGTKPWGMLLNRDGSLLYVTTPGDNTVLVINSATNQVLTKIPVGTAPSAFGTIAVPGADCPGIPATFTITVNVQAPSITHSVVTGTIIACAGAPSASPNIQQFKVFGSGLSGDITAMAPIGFEVSLSATAGFAKSVTLARTNGSVSNVVVYVRSADYAIGSISNDVKLSTPGLPSQAVPVRGFVNALPTVNAVGNQTKVSGESTEAISFIGTGDNYRWTNDKPGIGLPASGTGDIASFIAINNGALPIVATITVIPSLASSGCEGTPMTFTISVKPSLPPAISNDQPPNGVNTIYGTPSPVTSFTISGRDMREGIKVTPPAGVEVSTDNINFSNTITVGAAGTIAPTTIYVRLAKNAPVGSYEGSISLESTGVNTIYPQLPVSMVSPALLTVTASAKSKDYGTLLMGAPGSTDFTATGLQNGEIAQTVTTTYTQGAAATDPAGTYAGSVTPSDLTGGTFDPKNYTITYMNADLIVNKIPLTITADDKIKNYKDPNPVLTLTYGGFVNNESPAQLTSLPNVSTIADETSLPGEYPILVSGAASPNYNITLINGVLTVLGTKSLLKIPNTFSPNDDGINDTWNIANIDSYPGCTVNIYNRWGQNVFSSVGYGKSWDGRYKGTLLPVSTYYYIIDLKNDSKPYSGSITIIR